jgi:predicted enzyme related to lactoylglutathione lyase
MFSPSGAFSGFSINDLEAAKKFYGEVLGLTVTENEMGFIELGLANGARVLAYVKPNHEPASFTILNFPVDDVTAAVDDLIARGVTMEQYDGMPQDDKGVMRGNGPDIAWFRDPAGNVLSVLDAG